jgi:hypothetical protein
MSRGSRSLLAVALGLAGCLDYDALVNGARDLTAVVDQSVAIPPGADLALVAPDLSQLDLDGVDLAGVDAAAAFPIQLVGTSISNSQTTSLTVPLPPGAQVGDLVLLVTWWSSSSATATGDPAFNDLGRISQLGVQSTHWGWRIVEAGDASYRVNFSINVSASQLAIAFRGAKTASVAPLAVKSSTTWPVTVTTTVAGSMVVPVLGYVTPVSGWSPPAGFSFVRSAAHVVGFLALAPSPQTVAVARPVSSPPIEPLLTGLVVVQP